MQGKAALHFPALILIFEAKRRSSEGSCLRFRGSMMDRVEAVTGLVASLAAEYPDKGFKFNSKITCREEAGSVGLFAAEAIEAGEILVILVVIPESTRITSESILRYSQPEIKRVADDVVSRYQSANGDGVDRLLDQEDVVLQVLLVIVAVAHGAEEHHAKHAADQFAPAFNTWPESCEHLPIEWSSTEVENLKGISAHSQVIHAPSA
jgi:hypothetical protein